jgi:hypothetical protein
VCTLQGVRGGKSSIFSVAQAIAGERASLGFGCCRPLAGDDGLGVILAVLGE